MVDEWSKVVRAERRLVDGKAAHKYLYRLARASEPARGYGSRDSGRTIGVEAPSVLGECMINRSGEYVGRPGSDDRCIRLLTAAQVRASAAVDFGGVADLMVLKWSVAYLRESEVEIRYKEPRGAAQGSAKFPCVYRGQRSRSELDYTCLVAAFRVDLGSDGMHVLPHRTFRDEREEDEDWDP